MDTMDQIIELQKKQAEEKKMELAQEMTRAEGSPYETPGFSEILREAAADSIVLLENEDQTLPFGRDDRLAVFGRCQVDTFYVGYGSGGDVNPVHKVSILDGMEENPDLSVDTELSGIYRDWCGTHVPDEGYWGHWPYHYEEMELSPETVKEASSRTDKAVVVIGRAAGEDRENELLPGSYYLTDAEKALLAEVNDAFSSVTVLMNIGNVMDFSWVKDYSHLKALLIVWQLGQETGHAVADVLSGRVNPSGHLTDTIAMDYKDYPSSANFGNPDRNVYREGIFVGYRYFETKAKDRVLYPFGYGLSYSEFAFGTESFTHGRGMTEIRATVKNVSAASGKDALMVYVSAKPLPDRKKKKTGSGEDSGELLLPVPALTLCQFEKSKLLAGGEEQTMAFLMDDYQLSSYDDEGVTGHRSSFVLQAGVYTFYIGDNVRNLVEAGSFTQKKTIVTRQCEEAATLDSKKLRERILDGIREKEEKNRDSLQSVPETPILLSDVKEGNASLDDFLAQLSNEDLGDLSRGEGPMNSEFGTPGNTGIFGGTTKRLRDLGVPPLVTSDGPAGLRLMRFASLLPIGTALASTWDDLLVNRVFRKEAEEIDHYGIDVFLAPGLNIHRNPLCGRNFEYYSEDPFLAGWMAAAAVDGIQSRGASACPKHFACNNQETNRNHADSVLDERTLREIYLRAFEICVSVAKPKNLMTSYNLVNGVYSHYNYDLVTTILRKEWKYQGNVMTDWWMQMEESPEFPGLRNNAYRIRAGINVLMPGGKNETDQTVHPDPEILSCMDPKEGGEVPEGLTRAELLENARPVLAFALERLGKEKTGENR